MKFYINRLLALRLDVRDNVAAQQRSTPARTHHVEILLGLSILLGRKKPVPKLDVDSDGDGFLDRVDECADTPGRRAPTAARGHRGDRDGDGFIDNVDACPTSPGIAPDGCPDSDGDGFIDATTSARPRRASRPTAARSPDKDGDGILDADDKCPDSPRPRTASRTRTAAPTSCPKAVKPSSPASSRASSSTSARPRSSRSSEPTLDDAVKVLNEFPSVTRGDHRPHRQRRRARAQPRPVAAAAPTSVKEYLVDKGIADEPHRRRAAPAPTSRSPTTRPRPAAKNRRIEFKLRN